MGVIFTSDGLRCTTCESAVIAVQVAAYVRGYTLYEPHAAPMPFKFA